MRWERCFFAALVLAVACRGSDYPLRRVAYSEIVGSASIGLSTPPSIKKGDRFTIPVTIDLGSVTMPRVGAVGGRLQLTRQSAILGACEIDVQYDPAILKLGPLGGAVGERAAGHITLSALPDPRSGVVPVAVLEFEVVGESEMTTVTIAPRKFLTPEIPGLGSYSIPDRGPTIGVLFFSAPAETASRDRSEKR